MYLFFSFFPPLGHFKRFNTSKQYFSLSRREMLLNKTALWRRQLPLCTKKLNLIQLSSLKFRQKARSSCQSGEIDAKIQIFSLRCQSFLYFKLFKMRRLEDKDLSKELGECHLKVKIIQFIVKYSVYVIIGTLNCLLHYYRKVQHRWTRRKLQAESVMQSYKNGFLTLVTFAPLRIWGN